MKKYKTICSECDFEFLLDEPELGEVIVCPECGLNLIIKEIEEESVVVELTETDIEDWGQ
ncbi:MAG: lysine biosynthesis protein LysW [Alphaproteobacteria bacterium]|nr:lysine biosynthesis protein LysW [Alphaproteobacteria bacterium]